MPGRMNTDWAEAVGRKRDGDNSICSREIAKQRGEKNEHILCFGFRWNIIEKQ